VQSVVDGEEPVADEKIEPAPAVATNGAAERNVSPAQFVCGCVIATRPDTEPGTETISKCGALVRALKNGRPTITPGVLSARPRSVIPWRNNPPASMPRPIDLEGHPSIEPVVHE
jgi:hypothetical protein